MAVCEGLDPDCLERDLTLSDALFPNRIIQTLTSQSASSAMKRPFPLTSLQSKCSYSTSLLACGQTKTPLCFCLFCCIWWRNVCRLLVCLLTFLFGQKGISSHTQMKLTPKRTRRETPEEILTWSVELRSTSVFSTWDSVMTSGSFQDPQFFKIWVLFFMASPASLLWIWTGNHLVDLSFLSISQSYF